MAVAALIIVSVVGYRYQQYVFERNFTLQVNGPCDPATNTCFISDCSPEVDPACDTTPYEKILVTANEAPACLEEHTCTDFSCEGKTGCEIAYCDADSVEGGEQCSTK